MRLVSRYGPLLRAGVIGGAAFTVTGVFVPFLSVALDPRAPGRTLIALVFSMPFIALIASVASVVFFLFAALSGWIVGRDWQGPRRKWYPALTALLGILLHVVLAIAASPSRSWDPGVMAFGAVAGASAGWMQLRILHQAFQRRRTA